VSSPSYRTFPVTDELALIVNVQLFALLPPLEQLPDQIASRLLLARSVITVFTGKLAEAVVPTFALIPAGLDTTLSPLRPVARTVSVTPAVAGFTVSAAVRVVPP
jgi:hypothetical protein